MKIETGKMIAVDVRKSLDTNPKTQRPKLTIDNFLIAMQMDRRYANMRYNELGDRPEIHDIIVDGKPMIKKWSDADSAASENYMENAYELYSPPKHEKALRLLFEERRYHPIRDVVDAIKWDGEERCEHFLNKWALVEDSDYSREVSRLIFAGGIWRLYNPGCKFDDVPILYGPNQGEGKSTLVRFLAIKDEWYGEVTMMEGQQAIEQLQGKWICEISELLALTKNREQESAKAYITRTVDTYRKPWDKNVTDLPRRCIMIGSTNVLALSDKSGNRRYYPVEVHSNGYEIFDHEQEIRAYILQCWAEAREKYKRGEMPNYANRKLVSVYRQMQEEATQDDWRVGAIQAFLDLKKPCELTCVREISHRALSPNPDFPKEPNLIESKEISLVVNKMPDWKRVGTRRVGNYGKQKAWVKLAPVKYDDEKKPESEPEKVPEKEPEKEKKPEKKSPAKAEKEEQEEIAPLWVEEDDDDELPF